MQFKKFYPTKREQKGKMYSDYMKIEIDKGNISKREGRFWLRANMNLKKDPTYTVFNFYARQHRSANKQIPYNS